MTLANRCCVRELGRRANPARRLSYSASGLQIQARLKAEKRPVAPDGGLQGLMLGWFQGHQEVHRGDGVTLLLGAPPAADQLPVHGDQVREHRALGQRAGHAAVQGSLAILLGDEQLVIVRQQMDPWRGPPWEAALSADQ